MAGAKGLGRSGFTLMECIVSLAVGGLVVLAAQAAVQTTLDIAVFREEGDAALASLRAEAVRQNLRDWLEGAHTLAGEETPLQGEDRDNDGWPADRLSFVTGDGGVLLEQGRDRPLRVRLGVNVTDGLTLEYDELDSPARSRVLRLLPEVQGLDVRYLPEATTGTSEWTDSWEDADLPRVVELRFLPAPGETLPKELRSPLFVLTGFR